MRQAWKRCLVTESNLNAMPPPAIDLLDPKHDYVFKRLFGEAPALLVALINDLRHANPTKLTPC